MAFGSFDSGQGTGRPMAEINMVPLIDVMLVLLIIFIVTAPLLTHAVKLDLPKASSTPNITKRENIQLAIDADGKLFWNGELVTRDQLVTHFRNASQIEPQPEIHLRADRKTQYQFIAEVLADSANAGLTRIGFVSDPSGGPVR